jgi:hypothetical protein
MASQKLTQAITLIRSGNKQAAFPLMKELTQEEPNNEQVWLYMYVCMSVWIALNRKNIVCKELWKSTQIMPMCVKRMKDYQEQMLQSMLPLNLRLRVRNHHHNLFKKDYLPRTHKPDLRLNKSKRKSPFQIETYFLSVERLYYFCVWLSALADIGLMGISSLAQPL